eukprot:scaffold792_cov84-Cylindrotheca_fusiformis.AAC.8
MSIITQDNAKLSIRQIKSQSENITYALEVVGANPQPTVVVEALRVCGKCKRPDIALSTFEKYPSELARAMTISVLGSCEEHHQAVRLVHAASATSASYNAAIAACSKAKDWELALDVYNRLIPKEHNMTSTLTVNALLTILATCRKGQESLQVLRNFQERNNGRDPSRVTYQIVIHALVRSNMVDEAFEVLKNIAKQSNNDGNKNDDAVVEPTGAMFDMLTAAYNKRSDWESIHLIEQMRNPTTKINLKDVQNKYQFQHWEKLQRVGRGKGSYFVIGHVSVPLSSSSSMTTHLNITIGVQPHRNPAKNGIQLEFFENHASDVQQQQQQDNGTTALRSTSSQSKLGYLLMVNDKETNTSRLLGMFLTEASRGKGISKVCLAVWLWLCLQGSITPSTGVINKPLLALALQHTFGFVPNKGGIEIELMADVNNNDDGAENGTSSSSDRLLVYSPSRKSLQGAFSPWDIQNQNITILTRKPSSDRNRGRMVSVCNSFRAPASIQDLQQKVDEILLIRRLESDGVSCELNSGDIRRLYFGND